MAVWEGKKYKLEKSENFEEYMKELGVGFMIRKIGNNTYPTVELQKNEDGSFTFNTMSTFKNTTIKFKPGEEFDEETVDGRKVKSVCHFEGDTLIHEQKGEKPTTIERVFKEEEMIATMKINDTCCTRIYKVT